MPTSDPLLVIERLSVAFRTRKGVLRDVDLNIARGEVLGIVGESGSGKTTLLLTIMNYLPPNAVAEAGTIRFEGLDLLRASPDILRRVRGRRIGMVYQDPAQALNPAMRVASQIAEVRRYHLGETESTALERVTSLLASVGIEQPERVASSYPHQLSGGQQQRAMIAMALAGEPDLLLMDEPTTALDMLIQARLLDLIRDFKRRTGIAVLFVSHDLGAVAAIADRIGVLYAGELMEFGPIDKVLREPANPYTRGLKAAIPRVDARIPLKGIPGALPHDGNIQMGCVFANRCEFAAVICRTTRPQLVPIDRTQRWQSRCHFADELTTSAPLPASAAPPHEPARTGEAPLLRVAGLSVDYRQRGAWGFFTGKVVHAVRNVSFALRPEQVMAIVGESGSGKTTLARTLLRLQEKLMGVVTFDGEDIFALGSEALRRFRRSVQMVFQNPTSSLNPRKTVGDLVARPLYLAGTPSDTARVRAAEALEAVGLDARLLPRFPHQLSGGEKQRVAIARAFITEPKLVILDEPTTSLDVSVQASVLELLEKLKTERRCSYLLISHDLGVVRHMADDVVVMRAGEICEAGDVEAIFEEPRHPYTQLLLAAARRS